MNETLLFTVLVLCILGVLSAVILYFVAQKFKVVEDPRIGVVEGMLPGANCGGCGFPGCKGMADALVKNDDLSALYCPVGGAGTMQGIASYLGKAVADKGPEVAVIRCAGNCDKRPRTNIFNGASSCAVEAALYAGETSCTFGCLGQGDCVTVCSFGALSMNPISGLPEVDEDKCTACGACVKACPKSIIELRKKVSKGVASTWPAQVRKRERWPAKLAPRPASAAGNVSQPVRSERFRSTTIWLISMPNCVNFAVNASWNALRARYSK